MQSAPSPPAVRWSVERPVLARHWPTILASLSKARLSGLVVSTMFCGHLLSLPAPTAAALYTMLPLTIGTALSSGAAAALNQWVESPFDGQMRRTQCRVVPMLRIMPPTALYLGVGMSVAGVGLLGGAVSGVSGGLSAFTIFLYGAIYTPLKRMTVHNTAVGAIVGAIPPLIGWFGNASMTTISLQSVILPLLLFAWQFPHFHSLSYGRREEYARAGYWMMSVVDVGRAKSSALQWSAMLFPISGLGWLSGLVSAPFLLTSLPVNGFLLFKAWRWFRVGDEATARSLFKASLVHLPALMGLLLTHHFLC
jgi:protoheme IX farnesyltransferase